MFLRIIYYKFDPPQVNQYLISNTKNIALTLSKHLRLAKHGNISITPKLSGDEPSAYALFQK